MSLNYHVLVQGYVRERLTQLDREIESLRASQAGDTKSSAGDKFETSREMLQQQLDQLEAMRAVQSDHLLALELAARERPSDRIQLGSIVALSDGRTYLLATGLGKVKLADAETLFVISPGSPLGKSIYGLREGDACQLRGQQLQVTSVR